MIIRSSYPSHLLLLWPGMLLLSVTGLEPLQLPSAAGAEFSLAMNVLCALCVNLLTNWAMALTNPVLSSAGFALTIPAAALADGDSPFPAAVLLLAPDAQACVLQY